MMFLVGTTYGVTFTARANPSSDTATVGCAAVRKCLARISGGGRAKRVNLHYGHPVLARCDKRREGPGRDLVHRSTEPRSCRPACDADVESSRRVLIGVHSRRRRSWTR